MSVELAAMHSRLQTKWSESDLTCHMRRCHDCAEWKPRFEVKLRSCGSGKRGRNICEPCVAIRRERQREVMAERRRALGIKTNPNTARLMPEESVQDYVQRALPEWPNVKRLELSISTAPQWMHPEIKRGIREAMAA